MKRLAVVLAALTLSLTAHAAETWQLTWNAPPGCLTAAELARSVERRLGRPVFGLRGSRHVDGVVTQAVDAPRWRAQLSAVDEHGTVVGSREITADGDDCHCLDDSLVLVLAVAIGNETTWPAAEPVRAPAPLAPAPERERETKNLYRAVPAGRPPVARRWFGDGGLGVAVQANQLPAALSVGLVASVRPNLTEGLFLDFRFAVYPYTPIAYAQTSTGVVGGGLGLLVGGRLNPFDWFSFGLAVGAAGTGLLLENRALGGGLQARGRFDLLARLHGQFRLGTPRSWAVELGLEGGYEPVSTVVRLVSAAGAPLDLELPAFRFGLTVMLVWPMADARSVVRVGRVSAPASI